MHKTIKVFAVILIIAIVAAVFTFGESVFAASPGRLTCLVAGFDSAAENTDVLSVVDFDFSSNSIQVIQIPRDTYFNFGGSQNKINQLFPYLRSNGASKQRAMRTLTETMRKSLAIDIDGYIGLTLEAFEDMIEFLDGIYVDSDKDIELLSNDGSVLIRLQKGENFLSSRQAILLVRYRSGYARGDLERLEAQRLLINGLYKTIVRAGGYKTLATMLISLDGITSNISLTQVVPRIGRVPSISGMTITVDVIPGQALFDLNGVSYYSLNRQGTIDLLCRIPSFDAAEFDSDRSFLKQGDKNFGKIYNGKK